MGKEEITKRVMIVTQATAITLATSIDMRTIIMIMTGAMAILPTGNNDFDANVEEAFYANDVDHDNYVVTAFE